eukprot:scaffold2988_cov123-Isochrysis_galbana.AAC.9
MAAGALRGLVCVFFVYLLLVPGAKECPQSPQDDAGRETPERKGFRKSQAGVGWLTARAGRPGLDVPVPDSSWVPATWVLGRAWHRAAIGRREGW